MRKLLNKKIYMCTISGGGSDLPKIQLDIPEDWRMGQTIFNFLEWLAIEKNLPTQQSNRMADTFHLQNNDFIKYYNEYIKTIHRGGNTES